ncbi:MAG: universal stress protein [Tepidisphaeraceae bacterium]
MSSRDLARSVQDYLDAELHLERRRSEGGSAKPQEQQFAQASQKLAEALSQGLVGPEDALVAKAREYVEQVQAFHHAREKREDLEAPARRLEKAQRGLQDALYCRARGHACGPGADGRVRRILVAVDGSRAAGWAVDAAVALADDGPARLRLVHAVQLPVRDPYLQIEYQAVITRNIRADAEAMMNRRRAQVPVGIPCDGCLVEGDAAVSVIRLAREWGADYIVMGTRGHGRMARFLMGSTAEGVIRSAPCPVITVNADPKSACHVKASAEAAAVY